MTEELLNLFSCEDHERLQFEVRYGDNICRADVSYEGYLNMAERQSIKLNSMKLPYIIDSEWAQSFLLLE